MAAGVHAHGVGGLHLLGGGLVERAPAVDAQIELAESLLDHALGPAGGKPVSVFRRQFGTQHAQHGGEDFVGALTRRCGVHGGDQVIA